jgi:hypothetical protein
VQLLSEKETMSPLISRLREHSAENDILAVAHFPQGGGALLPAIGPFGGGEDSPIEFFDRLTAFTLQGRLDQDTPLKLELAAKDAAAAERVEAQLLAWLAAGKALLPDAKRQMEMAPAPFQETARRAVDHLEKVVHGAKLQREDRRVLVRVEAPGGLPYLLDSLLAMTLAVPASAPAPAEPEAAPADDAPARDAPPESKEAK